MASDYSYAAQVDDQGIVRQVISIPHCNDNDEEITAYCNSIGLSGTWIDTTFTGSRRAKLASVGDLYDQSTDTFVDPESLSG